MGEPENSRRIEAIAALLADAAPLLKALGRLSEVQPLADKDFDAATRVTPVAVQGEAVRGQAARGEAARRETELAAVATVEVA